MISIFDMWIKFERHEAADSADSTEPIHLVLVL
ncbi:Uncharacterised protein [Neisseria meningitidis]|nr:Uncharacterised protein [Neisseria meningitidis]